MDPSNFELLFLVFPFAIIGYFIWRYVRYGSLLGSLIGARVERRVGEAWAMAPGGMRICLTVHLLERKLGGPPEIGMSMTTRPLLSKSMSAMRLTSEEAKTLASLLEEAGRG